MPELLRLEIRVSQDDFPLAEALVGRSATQGWEEEDQPDGQMLLRVHSEERSVMDTLINAFTEFLPAADLSQSVVPKENWVEAWREYFTPVEAGDFLILPPWLADTDSKDKSKIVIEPKSAFGTGHHPSTTLCLEAISKLAADGAVRSGQRFLDVGTGTGVLGVACVHKGLSGIGVDIDPEAIANAMENRQLNGVAEQFEILVGSADTVGQQRFEVIIANILAKPLQEMASTLLDLLATEGCLILSGILAEQAQAVESAYAALGPARRLYAPSLNAPSAPDGVAKVEQPEGEEFSGALHPEPYLGQGPHSLADSDRPGKNDHWVCLFWKKPGA